MTREVVMTWIVIWLSCSRALHHRHKAHMTRTDVIHHLLQTYDGKIPPNFNGDRALAVTCSVYVNGMSNLDERDMDFDAVIYLRQRWKDERLSYKHLVNVSFLTLDSHMRRSLWTPDIFFINAKKQDTNDLTSPTNVLRLHPDGRVDFGIRVALTLDCPMALQTFPLDSQICRIDLRTYAFTEERMLLRWSEAGALVMNPKLKLSQFILSDSRISQGTQLYSTGNYSSLHIHFLFRRDFGYYVIQTYVPSGLVVVLSWVGFWIDAHAVAARVCLGATTVLTVTTQTAGIESRLPKVSYIKAMDVWLATCSLFVFGALLEFAFVNVLLRQESKLTTRRRRRHRHHHHPVRRLNDIEEPTNDDDEEDSVDNDKETPQGVATEPIQDNLAIYGCINVKWTAMRADKLARRIFPAIFFLFNVMYWSVYWYLDQSVTLPD